MQSGSQELLGAKHHKYAIATGALGPGGYAGTSRSGPMLDVQYWIITLEVIV